MRLNFKNLIEKTSTRKIALLNLILIVAFLINTFLLIEKYHSIGGLVLNIFLAIMIMSGLLIMISNMLIGTEFKNKTYNINS